LQAYCSPGQLIVRHCHAGAYAAVVLAGGYEEAGSEGRRLVRAGDVLVHHEFESHLDRIGTRGAEVLNIALPLDALPPDVCAGQIADPDTLARLYRTDPLAACALLLKELKPAASTAADWPDLLRERLASPQDVSLTHWAQEVRLARETVSRGFARAYGVSAAVFRLEARARRAWRRIVAEPTALATIAVEEGFSDQPHMTRAVAALTGQPPGAWRRTSHAFKTGVARSA
jgi:AraC-like DNA-binding protein